MLETVILSIKPVIDEKILETGVEIGTTNKIACLAEEDLLKSFQKEVSKGNLQNLLLLLNGKVDSFGNSIVNNMVRKFSTSLMLEIGLNNYVANTIAQAVVTAVIDRLNDEGQSQGMTELKLMEMVNNDVMETVGESFKSTLGLLFKPERVYFH